MRQQAASTIDDGNDDEGNMIGLFINCNAIWNYIALIFFREVENVVQYICDACITIIIVQQTLDGCDELIYFHSLAAM